MKAKEKFKTKSVKEVSKLRGAERKKYFSDLIKEFRKEYQNNKSN